MSINYDFEKEIENLSKEEEALKSSVALNKILYGLMVENKKQVFRLWVIILCLIGVIIAGIIGFFVYESQFETVETETSTETTYSYAEASGENAAINNIQGDQYNDQSIKNNYHKEDEEE